MLFAMCGCTEFGLNRIVPPGPPPVIVPVVERFVQEPLSQVDVLFVVDDTASMAQEQSALAAEFEALAAQLDDAEIAWQVGAITTSMEGSEVGWLQGSPWILTPQTRDREEAFAAMVQPGAKGNAQEAGLAAAIEAIRLSVPGGANAGFRREDAVFHVVFVSDADDQSDPWLGADPVRTFLDFLAEEERSTGLPARASAVVGLPPTGCTSATGTAQPAMRYTEVVQAASGVQVSICETDFAPLLEALGGASIAYQTQFWLRERPRVGSVRISLDGADLETGWSLDADLAVVRFEIAPPPGAILEISYLVSNEG